jgi:hypothetical protein
MIENDQLDLALVREGSSEKGLRGSAQWVCDPGRSDKE